MVTQTDFDFDTRTIADVEITPALAKVWLDERNLGNRRMRPRRISMYASDMENGRWLYTAEPIKFSAAGVLLDGQNRLQAIVKSGVTLVLAVATGLPAGAQREMDNNDPRRVSDFLHMSGETNISAIAAVLRRIVLFEAGDRFDSPRAAAAVPTRAEMLEAFKKYPQVRDYASRASSVYLACRLPASITSFCMWWFTDIMGEGGDCAYFFARLEAGERLEAGDPEFELRKQMLLRGSARRDSRTLLAMTIKAWNAYRRAEKIPLLAYKPGGQYPERFPEPV